MHTPPSNPLRMMAPLSDEELDDLDQFLVSDLTSDETMGLSALDGYLTAIVLGPTTLLPSQWLPGVWGPTEEHAPEFQSPEQAQHIFELILRHMNGIIWSLQRDEGDFDPLFDITTYPNNPHDYEDGEMWAYGFMQGIELCRADWQPMFDDPEAMKALRPIYLLGSDEPTEEENALTRWPDQREALAKQIPTSVGSLFRYWMPYRLAVQDREVANTIQRSQPKVGRNDPCPCGSGLKFKKCCGAAANLH